MYCTLYPCACGHFIMEREVTSDFFLLFRISFYFLFLIKKKCHVTNINLRKAFKYYLITDLHGSQ